MQRVQVSLLCVLVLSAALASRAHAVPILLSHQGRLLDGSDQPVTGVVSMTFRIYDAESAGTLLWTETHPSVQVSEGLFGAVLGSLSQLSPDLFASPSGSPPVVGERFLEIEVAGDVMTPRARLVASPYSVATERVSGDVHTAPGEVTMGAFGGTTTATIRASKNPGAAGSVLLLLDGSGSTTGTIRASTTEGTGYDFGHSQGSNVGILQSSVHPESVIVLHEVESGQGTPDWTRKKNLKLIGVTETYSQLSNTNVVTGASSSYTVECGRLFVRDPLVLDLNGDGEIDRSASSQVDSTGAEKSLEGTFVSGSGVLTNRFRARLDPDGTILWARSTKSSGAESRVQMATDTIPGGVAGSLLITGDGDGSGNARVRLTAEVKDADNGASCERSIDSDINRNGIFDRNIRQRVDDSGGVISLAVNHLETGGRFKLYSVTGQATPVGCTDCKDRLVSSLSVGDNSDGLPDRRIADSVDADVAERVVAADVDGDGLADYTAKSGVDSVRAHSVLEGLGGTTTGTIRMQASADSATSVHLADFDRDGNPDLRVGVKVTPFDLTGAGFPAATLRLDADADDDGVVDNTVSSSCDAETAEILLGEPGGGSSVQLRKSNIKGTIIVTNGGSMRALISGDSAGGEVTVGDTTSGSFVQMRRKGTVKGDIVVANGGSIVAQLSGDSAGGEVTVGDTTSGSAVQMKNKGKITGALTVLNGGNLRALISGDSARGEVTVGDTTSGDVVKLAGGPTVQGSLSISSGTLKRTTVNPEHVVLTTAGVGTLDTGIILESDGMIGIDVASPTHPVHHSSGAHLTSGGTWTNASDVHHKENFRPVDGALVLACLSSLPITQWNYKAEGEAVTHIGPTAQDFFRAFGVGADDKSISTIDPAGIALAAIQELHRQNQELVAANADLARRLDELQALVTGQPSR